MDMKASASDLVSMETLNTCYILVEYSTYKVPFYTDLLI